MRELKVLIYLPDPTGVWTMPPNHLKKLESDFPDIEFITTDDEKSYLKTLPEVQVLLSWRLSNEHLSIAKRLKWLHTPAAGVGGNLYPEFARSPIRFTNAKGVAARAIAEHIIGMILVLYRRLNLAILGQGEGRWAQQEIWAESKRITLLLGKTVGIVGYGAIGSELGKIARALGLKVLGIKRRVYAEKPVGNVRLMTMNRIDTLLSKADIVVNTLPLTIQTQGLFNHNLFKKMKRKPVFVNVGRGKTVVEKDLIRALKEGLISGACLDVFQEEPLPKESPLYTMKNVVVSPHVSALSDDYWDKAVELFKRNLRKFLRGDELINTVDKIAGY